MMRCGHCGRKLTDAALALGYCPSCGTHLATNGTIASPVQIQAEHHEPAPLALRGASPHAARPAGGLPPGSSPAPRPVQPIMAPPVPDGGRPMVDAAPSYVTPTPPVTTTRRSRNNTPLILLTLLTLIVVALVGVGALYVFGRQGQGPLRSISNSPTTATAPTMVATATELPPTATVIPSPTIPTVPGYAKYTSFNRHFGLDYPTYWGTPSMTNGSNTTIYTLKSSDPNTVLVISEASSEIIPDNITVNMQTYVQNDNGSGFTITDNPAPFTSGHNSWTRAQGSYTSDGVAKDIVALALNHNGSGYILTYVAPSGSFTGAGSVFAVMVSSFTFLQ